MVGWVIAWLHFVGPGRGGGTGDGGEHGGELDLGAGGVRNPLQLRASELLWRRRRAGRAG